jgi:putative glutamine amidotransferase
MKSGPTRRVALTFRYYRKTAPYTAALRQAGLEAVLAPPEQPVPSLHAVSGLVLTGGTDVNPARYGQAPCLSAATYDDARDSYEIELLQEAIWRDIPVLCICRGMQLLNVALGGALHQHIEGHEVRTADPSEPVHDVVLQSGALVSGVLGSSPAPVNSRHHQAVARVGTGLAMSARADDGAIEAIERDGSRFVVGVQWHPEDQLVRSPRQALLFSAFAAAVAGTHQLEEFR